MSEDVFDRHTKWKLNNTELLFHSGQESLIVEDIVRHYVAVDQNEIQCNILHKSLALLDKSTFASIKMFPKTNHNGKEANVRNMRKGQVYIQT